MSKWAICLDCWTRWDLLYADVTGNHSGHCYISEDGIGEMETMQQYLEKAGAKLSLKEIINFFKSIKSNAKLDPLFIHLKKAEDDARSKET